MTGSPLKNCPSRLFWQNALSLCAIALCSAPVVAAPPASESKPNSNPTGFTVTVERPVLKLGIQGEPVSELQAVLKLLGYYAGSVDGIYSDNTAQAVSKFQTAVGLSPDGIVGRETWNRLFPAASTSVTPSNCACQQPTASPASPTSSPTSSNPANPSEGATVPNSQVAETSESAQKGREEFPILKMGTRGVAVTNLQERLRSKGFFRGSVDGVFGLQTHAAVKAVQQQYQLQPDGVVGPATWKVLLP